MAGRPADADIHRIVAAALLLDPLDDGEQKAAAVLKGATPPVAGDRSRWGPGTG